jgi:hypothetical protein
MYHSSLNIFMVTATLFVNPNLLTALVFAGVRPAPSRPLALPLALPCLLPCPAPCPIPCLLPADLRRQAPPRFRRCEACSIAISCPAAGPAHGYGSALLSCLPCPASCPILPCPADRYRFRRCEACSIAISCPDADPALPTTTAALSCPAHCPALPLALLCPALPLPLPLAFYQQALEDRCLGVPVPVPVPVPV